MSWHLRDIWDEMQTRGFALGMERTEFGSGWDVGDFSQWSVDQKLGFSGNLLTQGIDDSLAQLEQWAVDARADYRDAGANLYASDHKFAAAAAAFLTGAVELGTRSIEGFASTARLGTNSYLREQAVSGFGYAVTHPGEVLGGVVDTLANNTYDQNLVLAMEFMLGGGHKALGGLASLSLKAGRKGLGFARAAGSAILEEMSTPVSLRQLQAGHLSLFGRPRFGKLRSMDPIFIGEETGAVWGTKVKYLNEIERQTYQLSVRDGKLFDAQGNLFDTSKAVSAFGGKGNAIFVMDAHGNVFASTKHSIGKFHHSSFLSGKPVASAGELVVENGVIRKITRRSGHYKPRNEHQDQFLRFLKESGVDLKSIDIGAGY